MPPRKKKEKKTVTLRRVDSGKSRPDYTLGAAAKFAGDRHQRPERDTLQQLHIWDDMSGKHFTEPALRGGIHFLVYVLSRMVSKEVRGSSWSRLTWTARAPVSGTNRQQVRVHENNCLSSETTVLYVDVRTIVPNPNPKSQPTPAQIKPKTNSKPNPQNNHKINCCFLLLS